MPTKKFDKSILVSFPSINQNVRAALQAFVSADWSTNFNTTLSAEEDDWFIRFLPRSLQEELMRRKRPPGVTRVYSATARPLLNIVCRRLGLVSLHAGESAIFSTRRISNDLDNKCAHILREARFGQIDAVYCYEDTALNTFLEAGDKRIAKIYELPIAYWEYVELLMRAEAERYPDWFDTFAECFGSPEKQERKTREMELADLVFVPSEFVLGSIPEYLQRSKKIVLAHFGSPALERSADFERTFKRNDKLRVLFVGTLSQRKGLADLFQAVKILKRRDIELVVLGSLKKDLGFYQKQYPDFKYRAPCNRNEVLQLMRSCDLFVLPSLIEGCALVQQEAMSCGLPIIITPNTGGGHLISEGKEGFTVPIKAPEKLAEKIAWCADHRDELVEMGRQAEVRSRQISWMNYQHTIFQAVEALVKGEAFGGSGL